jgi:hypothetical protein
MTSLDVDVVKAFVAIADLKSFTRAADALGTTQGAISVKLKRLEDRLGNKLIERTPRLVRLSARAQRSSSPHVTSSPPMIARSPGSRRPAAFRWGLPPMSADRKSRPCYRASMPMTRH